MIGLETMFLNYFYLKILHSEAADFWKKLRYVINKAEALSCFIVTNLWRLRLKAPMLISFNYSLYLGAFFLVIILLCSSWAHAKLQLFGIPLTNDFEELFGFFWLLQNVLINFIWRRISFLELQSPCILIHFIYFSQITFFSVCDFLEINFPPVVKE